MTDKYRKTVHKILEIHWHRNGVGGESFHVVRFIETDGEVLTAVVFDEPAHVAVISAGELDSCWRGDRFEPELRAAIKEAGQ